MPHFVLTHHKCASTWLMAWLTATGRLNGLSVGATQYGDRLPAGPADIMLLVNADYGFVSRVADAGLHVVRHPLDVVVSAWHSHRDTHSVEGWPELEVQRERLRDAPPKEGLTMTAEFVARPDFFPGTPGPLRAMSLWDYDDVRFQTLRMEDMVAAPAETIGGWLRRRLGSELVLPPDEDFRFGRFSNNRRPGEVDGSSHYRSGRAGQWRAEMPVALARRIADDVEAVMTRFYPDDRP